MDAWLSEGMPGDPFSEVDFGGAQEKAVKELKEAKPLAAKSVKLESDNNRLLGAIDYLYSQLKLRGVTNE
ncbi:hypothetical protein [uncultured Brevibacillus sp.]|uniref:hypothetical protein n=1 Tax=uncultured Brevibacillus sp. TaxID=169970 RepID=UPI00259370FF|nr:hypothetical protein [uncultured Brevibacillus sp.]